MSNWQRWYVFGNVLADKISRKTLSRDCFEVMTGTQLSKHFGTYPMSTERWQRITGWRCQAVSPRHRKKATPSYDLMVCNAVRELTPKDPDRAAVMVIGWKLLNEIMLAKKERFRRYIKGKKNKYGWERKT